MKKLLLMSMTIALRLGGALLLFVILARNVSVNDFGLFSMCFGVAAILGILVDFGFSQSLLRDIAREPAQAVAYISEGLSLKILIATAVFVVVSMYFFAFPSVHNPIVLQVLLLGYSILNSFAEFYGVSLRASGNYIEEAILQALYSGLLISMLLIFKLGVYEVAIMLVALKLLHLLLMHWFVNSRVGKLYLPLSFNSWWTTASRSIPYAADAGISNISANVDVVILASTLGLSPTGIYQAGQKLTQGMSAFALVISNVYLPKLSRLDTHGSAFRSALLQLSLLMACCGIGGSLIFAVLPSPLVDHVYGLKFAELKPLLPLFGVLLLIRYINGTAGVVLTAMGMQKTRVLSNTLSLCVLIVLSPVLISEFGLMGMIYTLLVSAIIISFAYLSVLVRALIRTNG